MKFFSFTFLTLLAATVSLVDAKSCKKDHFSWKKPNGLEICLKEGGTQPHFQPPKGKCCPSGWQWCIVNKMCVPQHAKRPAPKCDKGKFNYKDSCCHCPTGTGPHHSYRAVPETLLEERHFAGEAAAPVDSRAEKRTALQKRQFKMRKVNNQARAHAL